MKITMKTSPRSIAYLFTLATLYLFTTGQRLYAMNDQNEHARQERIAQELYQRMMAERALIQQLEEEIRTRNAETAALGTIEAQLDAMLAADSQEEQQHLQERLVTPARNHCLRKMVVPRRRR